MTSSSTMRLPQVNNLACGKEKLEKIYSHMNYDSVLVTYCSSGQFKRDLKSIGFKVDVLPGPKGKKEMVRAIK